MWIRDSYIGVMDAQPVLLHKLPQQGFLVLDALGWSLALILLSLIHISHRGQKPSASQSYRLPHEAQEIFFTDVPSFALLPGAHKSPPGSRRPWDCSFSSRPMAISA